MDAVNPEVTSQNPLLTHSSALNSSDKDVFFPLAHLENPFRLLGDGGDAERGTSAPPMATYHVSNRQVSRVLSHSYLA